MSYQVTVPLVLARDKEGKVHERYENAVIDWLDDDQKRHFLEAGLVVKVGAPAPVETTADDVETADDGVEKPAKVANKPVLIQWLVDNALDAEGNDYDADVLDNEYDKPGLWELIDAVE